MTSNVSSLFLLRVVVIKHKAKSRNVMIKFILHHTAAAVAVPVSSASTTSLAFSIVLTLLFNTINVCDSWSIRGVTLRNPPYIDEYEDNSTTNDGVSTTVYRGFIIDLIEEIKYILRFDYKLHFAYDGKYGTIDNSGNFSGMLAELINYKADFAIADIMMTDERQRFAQIEFSVPYMMEEGVSALIHSSHIENMTTLEELIEKQNFTYGIVSGGNLYEYFRQSRDPIISAIRTTIARNPKLLVRNTHEGIARVYSNESKYAFITESTFASFAANHYCDLSVIRGVHRLDTDDTDDDFQETKYQYFPRNYVIAFRKGAKYVQWFNLALQRLHCGGNIVRIRKKYALNRTSACNSANIDFLTNSIVNNFPIVFLYVYVYIYFV